MFHEQAHMFLLMKNSISPQKYSFAGLKRLDLVTLIGTTNQQYLLCHHKILPFKITTLQLKLLVLLLSSKLQLSLSLCAK